MIRNLTSTASKVATGGLVGAIVATLLAAHWDHRREQREALQNLVVVWHGAYIGNHRDSITEWLLGPIGTDLRGLPAEDYGPALVAHFNSDKTPASAILAVAGFFRTLDVCIRDDRCDKDRTHAAFSADAWEYYNLFGSLLRYLDCEQGYTGSEDPVLSVIRRLDDEPSGPERCKEL